MSKINKNHLDHAKNKFDVLIGTKKVYLKLENFNLMKEQNQFALAMIKQYALKIMNKIRKYIFKKKIKQFFKKIKAIKRLIRRIAKKRLVKKGLALLYNFLN